MTDILEEVMLIKVDTTANNNKFYNLKLYDDGTVEKRWGRVGFLGTNNTGSGGKIEYEHLLHEKLNKGYQRIDLLHANTGSNVPKLEDIAKTVLVSENSRGKPEVENLIAKLVSMNRHEILEASGGLIQVNQDGLITTPLGLLQADTVDEAKYLLAKMEKLTDDARLRAVEAYLRLVPQKVPFRRGWEETFLTEAADREQQLTFLDQLHDSIKWYEEEQRLAKTTEQHAAPDLTQVYKNLFHVRIGMLDTNSHDYRRINHFFEMTKNANHSSHRLKLKRVFTLESNDDANAYQQAAHSLGNEKLLWHGTRAFNLLSIFRKGLFVPPLNGTSFQTTGRMFGDGVYFSDQSTKSLNYSYGYWGGGNRDQNCYMLLAKVALGNEFKPKYFNHSSLQKAHYGQDRHGQKFDSISVKGGTCNVLNNEIIVWQTRQIQLQYLCEFDA